MPTNLVDFRNLQIVRQPQLANLEKTQFLGIRTAGSTDSQHSIHRFDYFGGAVVLRMTKQPGVKGSDRYRLPRSYQQAPL